MEQVHLKYGTSAVDFEIDGAKSVKYLYENKMRVIEDIKAEFLHCVTDGVIGTKPLKELIAPTDPVTIVISDAFLDASGRDLRASGKISAR